MQTARCPMVIAVVGVIAMAACKLDSGPRPPNTMLTGTWATSDSALDVLTLDLSQVGETVTGAGSVALGRISPGQRDTLTVVGSNFFDLVCLSICAPIALQVTDLLGDTLFLSGQYGDQAHFSAATRTSSNPGPFAAMDSTILIFSKK